MEERLRNRIGEHFSTLFRVAPLLQEANLTQGQPPTIQKLYLPSEFTPEDRKRYRLEKIAVKESQIQVAEAHDSLRRLRNALGLKALLLQNQKAHVRGYERVSKSKASIESAEKGVRRQKAAYRRAWSAMKSLNVVVGPNTAAGNLQELHDADVVPLRDVTNDRRFVGESKDIPWIWRAVGGQGFDAEVEKGVIGTVNSWNNEGRHFTGYLHAVKAEISRSCPTCLGACSSCT